MTFHVHHHHHFDGETMSLLRDAAKEITDLRSQVATLTDNLVTAHKAYDGLNSDLATANKAIADLKAQLAAEQPNVMPADDVKALQDALGTPPAPATTESTK